MIEQMLHHDTAEDRRLQADARREQNWKRWGPYLAERQWGTVREDYSGDSDPWRYFPHEQARRRVYRWGEDGLLGITDRECRLCFALALWNGRDPILKERLFGLTGPEGNHGEDVKEQYFYLDATPTSSYLKALYKYPQREFPYAQLVAENAQRGYGQPEYELADTGIFEHGYFDVCAEYAKAAPDDILIRITAHNRGAEAATLHALPTLWFRNTWSWGRTGEGYWSRPRLQRKSSTAIQAEHESLGKFALSFEHEAPLLFTENESNLAALFGGRNLTPHVKDAFHEYVIHGNTDAVNPEDHGTKAAAHYCWTIEPGGSRTIRARLRSTNLKTGHKFGAEFDTIFTERTSEANEFYAARLPQKMSKEERNVARQAYAGVLWNKQFYHYDIKTWLDGDPQQPTPPATRLAGRNADWPHLFNRDVVSMPDKWEYPWYAAWDLAFHMIPFAEIDPHFAKEQLILFLREWYMHPNGQLPAYEFSFGDVNPPLHAWACWRVYKMTARRGHRDRAFLTRAFQKLLINFTWWVNRKDPDGRNIFRGGFLGLDNIGVFDRSKPLPGGGHLEQADATAWMAFYCSTMLSIALELAAEDPAYEDVASKFFEHFIGIVDAMNHLGGSGLWDEEDGFYYDWIKVRGHSTPLRIRSMVGLIPLIAVEVLEEDVIERLPGFRKRMHWFLEKRADIARNLTGPSITDEPVHTHRLLAVPSQERLVRLLRYLLDEDEFLSPYGVRALSRVHASKPFELRADGAEYRVTYEPGESQSGLFGGNSNWRGPVWVPLNYLLVEALERYHYFYGDRLKVECPTGSGKLRTLKEVAEEIAARVTRLFLPEADGHRPCHGRDARFAVDPDWQELVLFYEYFHGDDGHGLGASHQTGWTALAAKLLEDLAGKR